MEEDIDKKIITVNIVYGDKIAPQEQQPMEINRLFNELPIRILNSHEEPFFYAEDIAKVLKLTNIRMTLRMFSGREIVSPEQRQKYNITTYKLHRGHLARDDHKILLTEAGVYRLIFTTRSELSERFRDWVYDVLHEIRTRGEYKVDVEMQKLKISNEKLAAENNTLKTEIEILRKKQDEFVNLTDKIYVFEIPNDPRLIEQRNIPPEDIPSDDEAISDDCNTIDNWELYCRMFPDENDRTPPFTYKITAIPKPNDFAAFALRYEVYVRSSIDTLKLLEDKLYEYRVNSINNTHYYECRWEIIQRILHGVII